MLTAYFGEVGSGRLSRLKFIGYWAGLAILIVVLMMSLGAALGFSEQLVGGDIQSAQQMLAENLGGVFLFTVIALGAVILFADLNIIAKRIRDMGLPGWTGVLVLMVVSGLLNAFTSPKLSQAFGSLVLLALLLVPSRGTPP